MPINITWSDNNGTETGHEVYVRSTQMTWDTDLPAPETVGADVTSLQLPLDETQAWYVIVVAVRGGEKKPSVQLYWNPNVQLFQEVPDPQTAYPTAMTGNSGSLSLAHPNRVEIPDAPALNQAVPLSIEWRGILTGGAGANKVLIEKPYTSHDAPYYQYGLYLNPGTNRVRFDLTIGGTRQSLSVLSNLEVVTGSRLVVSGTYDGSTIRLYVNGRLVGTLAVSGTPSAYSTPLIFNAHGNVSVDETNATHDEVRIWSVLRTQNEIVENLDRNLSGSEPGLAGLWNFNEASGTTVLDLTSNGNDGSIVGSYTRETVTDTWDGTNNEKWHYPSRLNLVTYEGSGQTVHPSVVRLTTALNGYDWWIAITPYPDGNDDHENPSIWASNDGVNWEVPAGLTNPVDPEPAGGFNSDPCLLLVNNLGAGTRELFLYWRETVDATSDWFIYLSKSSDGVTWSAQTTVLSGTSADIVKSPMVYIDGAGTFHLWAVDESGVVKRWTSSDGSTWTAETDAVLNGMPAGRVLWHLSGYQHPTTGRIHMIIDTATSSGGTGARAHYGYSDDFGDTINIADFITPDLLPVEDDFQYHGSLVEDPVYQDRFWVYLSGRNSATNDWYTYLIMRRLSGNDLYQENTLL